MDEYLGMRKLDLNEEQIKLFAAAEPSAIAKMILQKSNLKWANNLVSPDANIVAQTARELIARETGREFK